MAGMMPPPGPRAAMLAAATMSRCPCCPQCGQEKFRPAGLGTRREHDGHVEDVPRSSTSSTVIPAASALSARAEIRRPTRQSRVRWLCRRPAFRCRTPRGSPTAGTTNPGGRTPLKGLTSCWTSHARARNGATYDNDYAVVFHVTGGRIDAVTEYCDTSYMKRVLFGQ